MKLNKKGDIDKETLIYIGLIFGALFVIILVFSPRLVNLLSNNPLGDKCTLLDQEKAEKQIKDLLDDNKAAEALTSYNDFKTCFKDKTINFTKDEYEKIIELELKSNKLEPKVRLELYEQYVKNYPYGSLVNQLQDRLVG
jgi:hypothetical protein